MRERRRLRRWRRAGGAPRGANPRACKARIVISRSCRPYRGVRRPAPCLAGALGLCSEGLVRKAWFGAGFYCDQLPGPAMC